MKNIKIDGRTGEGGGQLVRMAVCLAALTGQSITITNIRGNRPGKGGGGLKSQHVTSIQWLANVTNAEVQGISVGSNTLTFAPRLSPVDLVGRDFKIYPSSDAASALLVIQATMPYALIASNDQDRPIELTVAGGTNVPWSPSFEYFDQVLLPTLETYFNIIVERRLDRRGWSHGPTSCGQVWLKVWPASKGRPLVTTPLAPLELPVSSSIERIDASVIVPLSYLDKVRDELISHLGLHFPGVDVCFKLFEGSGHETRWSVLLVAHAAGYRWAKDILCSKPRKAKSSDALITKICDSLSRDLLLEIDRGPMDEHLEDQLIVFQALAERLSPVPGNDTPADGCHASLANDAPFFDDDNGKGTKKDRVQEPLGNGSLHAKTMRWLVAELLPHVDLVASCSCRS